MELAIDPRYVYRAPDVVELNGRSAIFAADVRVGSMISWQWGSGDVEFNGTAEPQDTVAETEKAEESFVLEEKEMDTKSIVVSWLTWKGD